MISLHQRLTFELHLNDVILVSVFIIAEKALTIAVFTRAVQLIESKSKIEIPTAMENQLEIFIILFNSISVIQTNDCMNWKQHVGKFWIAS